MIFALSRLCKANTLVLPERLQTGTRCFSVKNTASNLKENNPSHCSSFYGDQQRAIIKTRSRLALTPSFKPALKNSPMPPIHITTESINNRTDWYHARATFNSRKYNSFQSTRLAAFNHVLRQIFVSLNRI